MDYEIACHNCRRSYHYWEIETYKYEDGLWGRICKKCKEKKEHKKVFTTNL